VDLYLLIFISFHVFCMNGVFAMCFYYTARVVFLTDFAIALKAILLCLYVFVKAQRNKTKIFTDAIILRRFLLICNGRKSSFRHTGRRSTP